VELAQRQLEVERRATLRARAVLALGPLTVLAGLVWAILQPYRITMFDPAGHGAWDLVVEPPLLVILVGLVFHFLIAPGVVEDLEDDA
jgi:hypothetical protein